MPTVKSIQTNFTSGILDPLLSAREDITFYYNGLQDGENIDIIPQGGARRRGGLQHVMELLPQLSEIDLSGATITAPQGGTAGNLSDGDLDTVCTTSGNIGTTNPFVVAHVDFGAAQDVDALDILDYYLASGTLADEFVVQYSDDDAVWTTYGGAFDWSAAKRSRRIRDNGGTVSARYWRIARIGATDTAAAANISQVKFWIADGGLSDGQLVPFAYSTDQSYMMVATDKNIDVLVDDTRTGSVAIDHTSSQLALLNWTQSLDTLLLFHRAVQPPKIFRQGADDEFDFRAAPFENIPKNDYGAGTGGVNEVQTLSMGVYTASDKVTMLLDGERTNAIVLSATGSVTASNIQAALRALNNTSTDGITVVANSQHEFAVTFGGDDGEKPWGEIDVSTISGTSIWTVQRTTEGEYPGEDIMSDARGWPRCGVIDKDRLIMGGISGAPNALLMSVVSEFFNFDVKLDLDTKALLFRANDDQVSAIYQISAGRNLSIFTQDGEQYIPSEPIDESAYLKSTTRHGIKEGIRVFNVDGALVFIQGDGAAVREFIFVDTVQDYESNNISVLSSHLIKDPVSVALRKAVNTDETDRLYIVNDDGTLAAMHTLRSQNVTAFTPYALRAGDKFLRVGVDKQKRVYFITERTINGTVRRFVEQLNSDLLLDGGGVVTMPYETYTATEGQTVFPWSSLTPSVAAEVGVRVNDVRLDAADYTVSIGGGTVTLDTAVSAGDTVRLSVMQKVITGLDHLDGETVQTFVDGSPGADYIIESDTLTLADYADTEIQYGFDFPVSGALMPFRIPESETLSGEKLRTVRAILSLYRTGYIEIRANNGEWINLPVLLSGTEDVLDKSMMDLLFTGEYEEQGLLGWSVGAPFEFRQTVPAPLTLRAIAREVAA